MRTTTSQPWLTVGAQAPTPSPIPLSGRGAQESGSIFFSRVSITSTLAPAHFGRAHKSSTLTHARNLTLSQPPSAHAHRGHAPPHTSHTLSRMDGQPTCAMPPICDSPFFPHADSFSMVFPMFPNVSPPNVGNRIPTFTIYLLDMYYYVYRHSSKCNKYSFSHFAMCHSGKRKHTEHALTLCDGLDGDGDGSFKYQPRVTVMVDSLSDSSIVSREVNKC